MSGPVEQVEVDVIDDRRRRLGPTREYRRQHRLFVRRFWFVVAYVALCLLCGLGYRPLLVVGVALAALIVGLLVVATVSVWFERHFRLPGPDGDPEGVDGRWIGPFDAGGIDGSVGFPLPASTNAAFAATAIVVAVVVVIVGFGAGVPTGNAVVAAYVTLVLSIFGILVAWLCRSIGSHAAIVRVRLGATGITITDRYRDDQFLVLPWDRTGRVQEVRVERRTRLIVVTDRNGGMAIIVYGSGNPAFLPALERLGAHVARG